MNVIITSDSTCDLSPELCRQHGIHLLPLAITLGERTGADGVDIWLRSGVFFSLRD